MDNDEIIWVVSKWLADPKVSRCEPATRGIWFDWLLNMHATDRSGSVTGTREVLSRLGRCTVPQVDEALEELKSTNTADVSERNGLVTVVNRRMKREYLQRKSTRFRVDKHRCNGDVTLPVTSPSKSSKSSGSKSFVQSSKTLNSKLLKEGGSGETGLVDGQRTTEADLLAEYVELCGKASLETYGGAWRLRIRNQPDLVRRILAEVRDMLKTKRIKKDAGAAAYDLWKRWAIRV